MRNPSDVSLLTVHHHYIVLLAIMVVCWCVCVCMREWCSGGGGAGVVFFQNTVDYTSATTVNKVASVSTAAAAAAAAAVLTIRLSRNLTSALTDRKQLTYTLSRDNQVRNSVTFLVFCSRCLMPYVSGVPFALCSSSHIHLTVESFSGVVACTSLLL